ncbi:MAG: hypothetical protein JKY95_09910 [Planctomycetaceae bacterium]|nr:hypothetical protein [Planctomycetaceae bacterium]
MKLSLRFLLAYLDDILSPADTAEVSKRLKQERPAGQLVKRIGEVVRRRRLSAPDPLDETAGKDANDVAEYLDNVMPAGQINEFEQSCLDSDELLAEAAISHQILTLVLAGDGEIPSSTRQRLDQIANSVVSDTPVSKAKQAPASKSKTLQLEPIPVDQLENPAIDFPETELSASANIPAKLELPQHHSNWKQSAAFVAVGLLFAAWVYSIATDPSFRNGTPEDALQNQLADNDQNDQVIEESQEAESPPQISKPPANETIQKTATATTHVTANNPGISIDPKPPFLPTLTLDDTKKKFQPPVVQPTESSRPTSPADAKTLVMINKDEKSIPPTFTKPDQAKPAPIKPPEKVSFTPSIIYNSQKQALIRQAVGQTTAILVPTMSDIEAGDQLFCTHYSEAKFTIGGGLADLQLLENTAITVLGADEHSFIGFDVNQGRLIFSYQSDLAQEVPKRIRLVIQDLTWYFELPKTAGSIVIEVAPQHCTHYETLPAQGLIVASAWATGSPVRLLLPQGEWEELKQGKRLLPLPAPIEQAQTDQPDQSPLVKESTPVLLPIPAWTSQTTLTLSNSQARDHREFINKISDSANLWLDLEGIVNDPHPRIAELAAQSLALGNRTDSLVYALVHSPHEESRTAAISGLRYWLPQTPGNREILRTLLNRTVNESTAFIVYNLLWGYDEKDAVDSELSRQLVTWLRHDQVAVRELSIYWISHLTGQKLRYRPLAPLSTREKAVISWERHLARVGALMPPNKKN